MISLFIAYGTLMDDEVLVLPLDMLKYELHKPAFEEVLSRFHKVSCQSFTFLYLATL